MQLFFYSNLICLVSLKVFQLDVDIHINIYSLIMRNAIQFI
jgi:hypothetical protein